LNNKVFYVAPLMMTQKIRATPSSSAACSITPITTVETSHVCILIYIATIPMKSKNIHTYIHTYIHVHTYIRCGWQNVSNVFRNTSFFPLVGCRLLSFFAQYRGDAFKASPCVIGNGKETKTEGVSLAKLPVTAKPFGIKNRSPHTQFAFSSIIFHEATS
jgi:hypothetical protein